MVKNFEDIRNTYHEAYAFKSKDGFFTDFTVRVNKNIALIYGRKEEDYIKVSLKILDRIDWNKDTKSYGGCLCGFYDLEKNELMLSSVWNSLLQTIVCFPYNPKVYEKKNKGFFVLLEMKELNEKGDILRKANLNSNYAEILKVYGIDTETVTLDEDGSINCGEHGNWTFGNHYTPSSGVADFIIAYQTRKEEKTRTAWRLVNGKLEFLERKNV